VPEDSLPVRWSDRSAIVTLPARLDASDAGQVRAELLALISRGTAVLIADMSGTVSCDESGADALALVYQHAEISGTQLRLVVTSSGIRDALSQVGLDRLVATFPSVEMAEAAEPRTVTSAVLVQLIDALSDGVALIGEDGTIALANQQLEDMFGYGRDELAGCSIESLVPGGLRAAHVRHRAEYLRAPVARPMGARQRLVGLRNDGATLPIRVTLSPVPTATGHFTLAVVRDAVRASHEEDLAELARITAASWQEDRTQELLDRVTGSLHHVGLSLHSAADQPHEVARARIGEAVRRLDQTIQEIRAHALSYQTGRGSRRPPANGSSS
jgi:PAS domain S-box-containing protein